MSSDTGSPKDPKTPDDQPGHHRHLLIGEGREDAAGESTELLRIRYQELVEELRVILPGVQVLFAFLITAPFSGRFGDLDVIQRRLYAVALATTTAALMVLLAPVAYHRLSDREDRADRIAVAVKLKLAGLALLGVSVTAAMWAVVGFVFSNAAGAIAAGAVLAGAIAFWLVFPTLRRALGHRG